MKLRGYLFAAATTATAVAGLTVPAQAASLFSNEGISFDKDTTVNFTFTESHGRFRSDFKVQEVAVPSNSTTLFSEASPGYDSPTNDWEGTCGTTVTNCNTSFKFEAGKTYTLVLTRNSGSNGVAASQVYSTTSLNNNYKQAAFSGDLLSGATVGFEDIGGSFSSANCATTGSTPKGDCDFNDFIVTAQSETTESVPEPATLAGLGAVAAGFVASRRRRKAA